MCAAGVKNIKERTKNKTKHEQGGQRQDEADQRGCLEILLIHLLNTIPVEHSKQRSFSFSVSSMMRIHLSRSTLTQIIAFQKDLYQVDRK